MGILLQYWLARNSSETYQKINSCYLTPRACLPLQLFFLLLFPFLMHNEQVQLWQAVTKVTEARKNASKH